MKRKKEIKKNEEKLKSNSFRKTKILDNKGDSNEIKKQAEKAVREIIKKSLAAIREEEGEVELAERDENFSDESFSQKTPALRRREITNPFLEPEAPVKNLEQGVEIAASPSRNQDNAPYSGAGSGYALVSPASSESSAGYTTAGYTTADYESRVSQETSSPRMIPASMEIENPILIQDFSALEQLRPRQRLRPSDATSTQGYPEPEDRKYKSALEEEFKKQKETRRKRF